MLSKTLEKALNDQIQRELASAYLYLSMVAYFEEQNLPGFARWMRVQFHEEQFHAFKIFDFVLERGGTVTLQAIEAPPSDFQSPVDVFERTLAHEQKVTAYINDLYALAVKENDYASQVFLQWFIDEQVEEEKNAADILANLRMIEGSPQALFMLDRELGTRTLPPEATPMQTEAEA
ncbi:MAG: ferritin [Anaerolineae bacterium]|nr:MAG: ferritin [Anaerolineae bacterium]